MTETFNSASLLEVWKEVNKWIFIVFGVLNAAYWCFLVPDFVRYDAKCVQNDARVVPELNHEWTRSYLGGIYGISFVGILGFVDWKFRMNRVGFEIEET